MRHSFALNIIGDEGMYGIAEALKTNSTLTNIWYLLSTACACVNAQPRSSFCFAITHSLDLNKIGDKGALVVAEALKSNATLKELRCVSFAFSSWFPSRWLRVTRAYGAPFFPRERAHSIGRNSIGDEGARAVAEALKSNATLTLLECVPFLLVLPYLV